MNEIWKDKPVEVFQNILNRNGKGRYPRRQTGRDGPGLSMSSDFTLTDTRPIVDGPVSGLMKRRAKLLVR